MAAVPDASYRIRPSVVRDGLAGQFGTENGPVVYARFILAPRPPERRECPMRTAGVNVRCERREAAVAAGAAGAAGTAGLGARWRISA